MYVCMFISDPGLYMLHTVCVSVRCCCLVYINAVSMNFVWWTFEVSIGSLAAVVVSVALTRDVCVRKRKQSLACACVCVFTHPSVTCPAPVWSQDQPANISTTAAQAGLDPFC